MLLVFQYKKRIYMKPHLKYDWTFWRTKRAFIYGTIISNSFFRNDCRVHRLILCQKYMMFPLVLQPTPFIWGSVFLCLRSPKGGCYSTSDDLSCSLTKVIRWFKIKMWRENRRGTGWSMIYLTITKCNNFTNLQQIIFIYVLNCSLINEIYVKK